MKIALIGSAPSSVALAPYDDPAWTIWACSPGAWRHLRRVDQFFELHRFVPTDPQWDAEYVGFLQGLTVPLHMIEPLPQFPASVAYPKAAMIERFGPNFFTSSLAWMAALAIAAIEEARKLRSGDDDEIAFYGVDMAATEEYALQKPGCLYFIEKARELGIRVTVPPESDLLRPPPLYGIGEADPMRIKLMARRSELEGRMRDAAARASKANAEFETAMREQTYFQGALEDCQYHLNTWCG